MPKGPEGADPKGRKRWNIEVTEADIANATIGDSYKCVVSQAIARVIPDATHIDTDIQTIRFTLNGARHIFLTPYTVAGYVVAFDAGDEIHPFAFQIRNPTLHKRPKRTAAGKEVKQIENRRRSAELEAADHGRLLADDKKATVVAKRKAKAAQADALKRAEEAKAEEADVRASYREAGVKLQEGGRSTPPRVHKRKSRAYGHRLLRVNQADDRKHYA